MSVIKPVWGAFASVIHLIVGVVILMLSAWFIAACALAGVGFNYVIPAVAIRGLAMLRIGSGYASLWLSHKSLLAALAALRLNFFKKLKDDFTVPRGQLADALSIQTEQVAAMWVNWLSGMAGTLLSILLSTSFFVWVLPELSAFWWGFIGCYLLLFAALLMLGLKQANQVVSERQAFQVAIDHHLLSAPLWHMQPQVVHTDLGATQHAVRQRQRSIQWAMSGLVLVSLVTALIVTVAMQSQTFNMPLYLVLPILLFSSSDWLGRGLSLQSSMWDYLISRRELDHHLNSSKKTHRINGAIHSLCLQGFKAESIPMEKIDFRCAHHGLTLVLGSSGTGKTKLLEAISGMVPYQGERIVNSQTTQQGWLTRCVLVEQFPYCLAGSLRANLQVAAPQASDEQLRKALVQAGLAYLTDLSQWLGYAGRRLSGGELKRLGLARALLADADVLLFDEPFEGLDEDNQQIVAKQLMALSRQHMVFVATHQLPSSLSWNYQINLEASIFAKPILKTVNE